MMDTGSQYEGRSVKWFDVNYMNSGSPENYRSKISIFENLYLFVSLLL